MKNGRELLILGAGGTLGTALTRVARQQGHVPRGLTRAELDITDRGAVGAAVADFAASAAQAGRWGVVVNAAAYTDVEKAEDEPERAYLVNGVAPGWLAAAADEEGLPLVHISTDFVFDGRKTGAYTEGDKPHPLSVYGSSKLAGEQAVFAARAGALVVRTAWVYGLGGDSFPMKIIRRARAATAGAGGSSAGVPTLQVVVDEVGSPTYAVDLAGGLLALLAAGARGLYHLTGGGYCSRYELALETLRLAGFAGPGDLTVEPVESACFPTKATRPHRSVLDCGKAARLGVRLPPWQDGLARFLGEL